MSSSRQLFYCCFFFKYATSKRCCWGSWPQSSAKEVGRISQAVEITRASGHKSSCLWQTVNDTSLQQGNFIGHHCMRVLYIRWGHFNSAIKHYYQERDERPILGTSQYSIRERKLLAAAAWGNKTELQIQIENRMHKV
jgi:hypothetical protein